MEVQDNLLQTIMDSISEAVITTDTTNTILLINKAACDLFGYTADELVGQSVTLLIPEQHRGRFGVRMPHHLTGNPGAMLTHGIEVEGLCKDGMIFPADLSINKITLDGKLLFTATIRDLSSHRKSEQYLQVQYAIARILAEDNQADQAATHVLQAICEILGWTLGSFWRVDSDAQVLRCIDIWHTPLQKPDHYIDTTQAKTFEPGIGMPGQVWRTGQPIWIEDSWTATNFPRVQAAIKDGLHAAFCFPILGTKEILGVFEFLNSQVLPPNERLLTMFKAVGRQVGQYLERKRAEGDLVRSQRLLSDFVENAAMPLHWVGADGTILWANQAELDMLGYTADEYIGHNIVEFHADDRIEDILHRLACNETLHDCEAVLRCKDGSLKDVLINSNVLFEDNEFIHTRCFTRDITEQKRVHALQEQLAAIVEGSDDAIIGKDLNGIITSWNKGAERMYGYTADEVVGKHISILIPPDHPNDVLEILARIKRGERVIHYETKRMSKNGKICDVSLTVSPIHDRQGNVIGASKIARDITERKERDSELARLLEREQEARTMAEEAVRSRDEFLSVAAHELRTPVTSLRGFTELLLRQLGRSGQIPSDRLRLALDHIDEQSRKLTNLMGQLLDISRIEAGKLTINPIATNLTTLIEGVIEQVRITVRSHQIVLKAPTDMQINVDPLRIEQVITNLLDNAVKYTEGGTIHLEIGQDKDYVLITVADEGVGVPPEQRDHIFERFYQAHAMSSGMGLGLYISRQIIELHDGTIKAEFPAEGGTQFIIRLPSV